METGRDVGQGQHENTQQMKTTHTDVTLDTEWVHKEELLRS